MQAMEPFISQPKCESECYMFELANHFHHANVNFTHGHPEAAVIHVAGTVLLNSVRKSTLQHSLSNCWIIDNGATDHMSFQLSFFHNTEDLTIPLYISMPTGSTIKVTRK